MKTTMQSPGGNKSIFAGGTDKAQHLQQQCYSVGFYFL